MAPHAPRPRRRSGAIVLLPLLVVTALLAVEWVRVGGDLDRARTAVYDRRAAVEAAERYALNLMAVDYRTVDRDVRRVLDASTGQARQEYARDADRLKEATRVNKAVQTGVVRAAGLVSMDGSGAFARVLVVADSVVRWDEAETAPQDRFYRWSMDVTKLRGAWWVSKLEQVA
ncbi:hypothetical protein [Sphaerisporangium sp. TRM90804]|uniref:hypothetical protein n=1 Tax=Sphaerisporangium sp. TRM90804 TaxID=3031113 RepID=UPI002446AB2D|nr:hypothetical protein [Sphaerisporangium sp. TRM90804]MDH2427090.1 hypothetical protein [Sphaerisporangium sp. TRM90804]